MRPELRAETNALGGISILQSAPEVQDLLRIYARDLDARLCVDVGSFTGGSALAMAEGSPKAEVIAIERNPEWAAIARRHWQAAGVADRIALGVGPAEDLLAHWLPPIDLAFLDADKVRYRAYYERLLPHVRAGGYVIFDDTNWFGMADAPPPGDVEAEALHELNAFLLTDTRVTTTRHYLGNGVTLCRKLGGLHA
jgi:predicted O-methyltransferase YrrM